MLLGQPAVYPQALVDALARLFAGRASVEAAYLAHIDFPDEATSGASVPHPIIGILSADYEKEIRDIGLVAKEAYGFGPVDFLDMRAATEGIAVYLRDKTRPFYVRAGGAFDEAGPHGLRAAHRRPAGDWRRAGVPSRRALRRPQGGASPRVVPVPRLAEGLLLAGPIARFS